MKTGSLRCLAWAGSEEPPRRRGASARDPGDPCGERKGLALRFWRCGGPFGSRLGEVELSVVEGVG